MGLREGKGIAGWRGGGGGERGHSTVIDRYAWDATHILGGGGGRLEADTAHRRWLQQGRKGYNKKAPGKGFHVRRPHSRGWKHQVREAGDICKVSEFEGTHLADYFTTHTAALRILNLAFFLRWGLILCVIQVGHTSCILRMCHWHLCDSCFSLNEINSHSSMAPHETGEDNRHPPPPEPLGTYAPASVGVALQAQTGDPRRGLHTALGRQ